MFELLYLAIFLPSTLGLCPRTPSPSGYPASIAKTEIECALKCKAEVDCFGYMFKALKDFQKGPNSFSSNCMLQTAFDRHFMAEEVLQNNEYINKVCVTKSSDMKDTGRFIEVPYINVSNNAREAGFTHRVEYPDQNIAKFYKVLNMNNYRVENSNVDGKWYLHRLCAAEGGLLATPYDPGMAQILYNSIQTSDPALAIGQVLRAYVDVDGVLDIDLTRTFYVHVSGKIGYGNTPSNSEPCEDYKQTTFAYSEINPKILAFRDGDTDWKNMLFAFGGDGQLPIANIVCEFQGSINWSQKSKAEATNHYSTTWRLENSFDGYWNLNGMNEASAFVSGGGGVPIIIQITLPLELALRQVIVLPRTDADANRVWRLFAFVSSEPQDVANGKINYEQAAHCGEFEFGFNPTGNLVYSLVCEKCMPIGKYVMIGRAQQKMQTSASEISLIGQPIKIQ